MQLPCARICDELDFEAVQRKLGARGIQRCRVGYDQGLVVHEDLLGVR